MKPGEFKIGGTYHIKMTANESNAFEGRVEEQYKDWLRFQCFNQHAEIHINIKYIQSYMYLGD